MITAPLPTRFKASLMGIATVVKKPSHLILALVVSFFMTGIIIWALNFSLVGYILFDAPLSIMQKLDFFWSVQTGLYATYSSPQASSILLFGLLFGLNVSLLVFVMRGNSRHRLPKKSGGAGILFALLGGGCIACGTSILAPLFASFGAVGSVYLRVASTYLSWAGILFIVYSIYRLGLLAGRYKS